jgi:predicted amidohydrolase
MDLRIRLAQIDTTLGNLAANLETHVREVRAAAEAGIQLIVFPELSLTGYFLKDQVPEVALRADAPILAPLVQLSRSITIAVGLIERSADGRLFNSMLVFEDGRLAHVHRKVHLVSYGLFEESRDLAAGESFTVFESKHGRLGFLVCEDMWHIDGAYLYFLDGVDALIVPSASPARGVSTAENGFESMRAWGSLQDAYALLFRTWVVYVGRVGWEDGVAFAGKSRVIDPFGREAGSLGLLETGRLDARLTSAALERSRAGTPLRRDERPLFFARELATRAGFPLPSRNGEEDRA